MNIEALADALAARLSGAPKKPSVSFAKLFDTYMSLHARQQCRSWRNMERIYNSYLAQWSDRNADEITRLEIVTLHSELGERVGKTTANRVVQLLRPVYNKGLELGVISCPNPAAGVRCFRLESRERFLEKDEVDKLFAAVETLRYEITKDFIYMCLFTAARRDNVAAMQWADINLERAVWRIPTTKNGSSQYVPLTDQALAVLHRRQRNNPAECKFVFPSHRSKSGRLTKPERAWREVVERSGLENARMHDLRRTLASWQALTGSNLSVIAASLGHRDLKSTQVYARLNVAAVRASMETATNTMTGALKHERN